MPLKFKGVIPPMITPFNQKGDVDYGAFAFNIEKWNETKLAGYLVLGSNSEAAYLSEDEKIKSIEITVEKAEKDRVILAGTGMESERETIRLTNIAADIGAHAALILTPNYYLSEMNANAIANFFTNVADNVKIPILLYNVPKFTHLNIQDGALKKLATHKNIIGMKDSTGDIMQLVRFQNITKNEDFQILTGTASAWFPALTLGVQAGIFALANCNPSELAEVQELYENGEIDKAQELYRKLSVLNTTVTASYGVPGLKYACDILGYKGMFPRSPLLPLSEEKKRDIERIFGV
jgi:4-hydroxy-2-oxoglutarate aldolase